LVAQDPNLDLLGGVAALRNTIQLRSFEDIW
jgi:hypothetical protein